MSEREEREFHADARARDGLQRRCKACRASKDKGKHPQKQATDSVEMLQAVPPDWRIAGTAFRVTAGYARSFDGDWWQVSGTKLKPVYADDVQAWALPMGRAEVERILRGE